METTKLGEQEASAQELGVEQETKEEDITQGTMKQELEIKIKEKVASTTTVEQEGLWASGQKVDIKNDLWAWWDSSSMGAEWLWYP